MRDPVVLAVNVEAIEVRIAPAHGDLNGVMEIGDRLIAAQQNAAPDHRPYFAQSHLELVDANLNRFGNRSFIVSPAPGPIRRFPGILCSPRILTSTHFANFVRSKGRTSFYRFSRP
jgi:hypothetical protein